MKPSGDQMRKRADALVSLNRNQLRLMVTVNKAIIQYDTERNRKNVRDILEVLAIVCADVVFATGNDQESADYFANTIIRESQICLALLNNSSRSAPATPRSSK